MTDKKQRKSLDDALAEQFVYGGVETTQQVEPIPETNLQSSTDQPPKATLMEKLTSEPKERTVRLTVDLSESQHKKLSMLAAKTGRKKADIVRYLLDEALKEANE